MPYPLLHELSQRARRTGWYATRQYLLKRGHSLREVASVLVYSLRVQGASA